MADMADRDLQREPAPEGGSVAPLKEWERSESRRHEATRSPCRTRRIKRAPSRWIVLVRLRTRVAPSLLLGDTAADVGRGVPALRKHPGDPLDDVRCFAARTAIRVMAEWDGEGEMKGTQAIAR
jgi:hypothetical protein